MEPPLLASESFDPEKYIAASLMGSSPQDVQNLYQSLKQLQFSTSKDLQANVFNNYASFVSLSHEISTLTSDLSQLSQILNQYSNFTHSISNALQREESDREDQGLHRGRRGAQNRSSIADLAQIYIVHLQELWQLVDGSQKFLPAVPGRHVIKEYSNWIELNAATWKPMRSVNLILLNDHLLVAVKKRAKSQQQKAVANRCWNLTDIELRKLSDDGKGLMDVRGAVQITRGRDIALYAPENDSVAECAAFVDAFNSASNDLYNRRIQSETPPKSTILVFIKLT